MSTEVWLFMGVITGAFGMGYIVYGRKQQKAIPLIAGIGLCGYIYFVDNLFLAITIGIVLIVSPFVIKV